MSKLIIALWQKFTRVSAQGASVAAGRDINNSPIAINHRDPQDKAIIESLLADKQSLIAENSELKAQIEPAVVGLTNLNESQQEIEAARRALATSDTNKARVLYQQAAQRTVDEGRERFIEAAEYYRRLGALSYLNDTADALSAYQRASELDPSNLDAWNQLGHLYRRVGELAKSIDAYETLLTLSEGISDEWQAFAYSHLGIVYRTQGELGRAMETHEKSLKIFEALDHKLGKANQYGNIGVIYFIRGELDRAIEMYNKSLKIYKYVDDGQAGMAKQYGNLGNIYRKQGELDRAIETYDKSLKIFEALGHLEDVATVNGNLGVVFQMQSNLDQAIEMHEISLNIYKELGLKEGIANQYANLSLIHQRRGKTNHAIKMIEESLKIFEDLGHKEGIACVYVNLGHIYKMSGDLNRTKIFWTLALEIYRTLGSTEVPMVFALIAGLESK